MRILIQSASFTVQGDLIEGDLDGYFLLRTDAGDLLKVMGWLVEVQIMEDRLAA